jgi:hypothetical protein
MAEIPARIFSQSPSRAGCPTVAVVFADGHAIPLNPAFSPTGEKVSAGRMRGRAPQFANLPAEGRSTQPRRAAGCNGRSPVLLQAGVVSYHDANELLAQLLDDPVTDSRWGDYSATSVDPTDPNRFWIIQMYPSGVDSSSGMDVGIWSTQITEILTASPVLSITVSNANAVVSWPGTAITFNLESNTNLLTAGGWTVVTPNFSTNNGQVYYQTSLTNGVRFFRLHKP